ncbi:ATP-binding protein [Pelagimonas sp. KU-00592-HH]|uniref:hybrid sensor histidine kinase/response regulator n=1 Tax=Pelagimonas sp. KU-00592-HH TaxID=3127651 RepID=UPI00333FFCA9
MLGGGLAVLLAVTLVFSRDVITDLESLNSANSDNVQWTLTQVEVEYLRMAQEISSTVATGSVEAENAVLLADLRRSFDVFYSRVGILQNSPIFADLRRDEAFFAPLGQVAAFLETQVATIDAPDEVLVSRINSLHEAARGIEGDVREVSVAGLSYFALQSDLGREEIALTLEHLAILVGILLLALTGVSLFLLSINRQMRFREAELTEANDRMNTILSTSLDGVVVTDAEGRVLEFNRAAEQIFQRDAQSVRGLRIGDVVVPPHLRELHDAGMKRMIDKGERRVVGKGRVQLEGMRANGEVFPVELALQSAMHEDSEIFIAFLRDISQRVADEQELIEARDKALLGEKAKADILTLMSHEIRTPLNGILGNLSLLEDTRLSGRQSVYLHNMQISGKILMQHVDAVLDIESFEAGKLQIVEAPVDLGALMQDIVDGQSGSAASRGNDVSWRWVGPPATWVLIDGPRLQQVLLNLVGNAIKFTENGRVIVEAEVQPEVDKQKRPLVEFRVSDSGIGIPEADLQRIFDDFHTSDASFGRRAGGTGLGLGIARRLVKAMGGEIGVESVEGHGCTFWFRLPMATTTEPEAVLDDVRQPDHKRNQRILVVEDNQINQQVIRNMLEREGHEAVCVDNGRDGVEMASEHRFDMIFMDISMPVLDGISATREIRNGSGVSSDVPIIAVSANVLPKDQKRFFEVGMNGFVGKPLTLEQLRSVLGAASPSEHPEEIAPVSSLVDPAQIEEMRENVGPEVFATFLTRFIGETDALLDLWDTIGETGNLPEDMAGEAHKIAGSAAVFGAVALRGALLSIEEMAKDSETASVREALPELQRTWSETRERLEASRS